jgi:hypothetical protein
MELVAWIVEIINVYILLGNSEMKRLLGRPRRGWDVT